ncbi:MAG: sigma-70 family RNA polymerase sigma factor [Gammaproteobacteria bacterium]|nr:sigma-70 family RNA polymerase sigma factor [Gammaproteobacteria bacterium]
MTNEILLPLLSAAAQGDRGAFADLYENTSSILFALCLKMLKRRDWAEDVVQDAYVKVWHHANDYHAQKGSVLTWMISIARYRALDVLKRKEHQLVVDMDDLDVGNDIGEESDGDDLLDTDHLQHCLEQLKDDSKQTIEFAFFYGFTHQELAARMDRSLGTIKSWIRRGLAQLRECLET